MKLLKKLTKNGKISKILNNQSYHFINLIETNMVNNRHTLLFSVLHKPGKNLQVNLTLGSLQRLLDVFKKQDINLHMIRSRPSRAKKSKI
jgi:prephenate dehydratase